MEAHFHALQTERPNMESLHQYPQITNLADLDIAQYMNTKAATAGAGKEPARKRSCALQNA